MYSRALRLSQPIAHSFSRGKASLQLVRSCSGGVPTGSGEDADAFRKFHDISLKNLGGETYDPVMSFDDTPFHPAIVASLKRQGYSEPTHIQAQSWPIAMAGRDMISIARTGSGKTCAFLLPAFQKIAKSAPQRTERGQPRRFPTAVVLAPTRELALQIENEANKFAPSIGLTVASFYGGTSKGPQFRTLSRGVDVVVGTPGRLNDLIDSGALNLKLCKYLVLDEADRMLDMGFEPQIRSIIDECSPDRQNLFFTATWPKGVQQMAQEYLKNPVTITVGSQDTLNANSAITQHVHLIKPYEKPFKLEEILQTLTPVDSDGKSQANLVPKTLVFVGRKGDCDELAYDLRDLGYPVGTLHGDKEQNARTAIMHKYRKSEIRILVATDVAARGLDVKDIEVVINYDFPPGKSSGIEDYVHRIGRTARGTRTGVAHSFFTQENHHCARDLVGILERCGQEVSHELRKIAAPRQPMHQRNNYGSGRSGGSKFGKGGGGGRGGGGRGGQQRPEFDPIGSGGGKKKHQMGDRPNRFKSAAADGGFDGGQGRRDSFGEDVFERKRGGGNMREGAHNKY
jgi:ATP-dependent RNA helicase DDX5/DBP2